MNITEFIYNLSRDLSDKNINLKYDKFIEFISNSNIDMDDLYYATNLISNNIFNEENNFIKTERQESLNMNSNFYIKLNEIISNKEIESKEQKQMLVETFILKYERDFILNLINNIDHTIDI